MQTIERSATVPYSAQQMYDLVNDVARYPEFIPFCLQGVVHEHRSDFMRASLVLGKGCCPQAYNCEFACIWPINQYGL